ncbi:hypothetical protein MTO96_020375 [Rhipicephalus appendiculatus]
MPSPGATAASSRRLPRRPSVVDDSSCFGLSPTSRHRGRDAPSYLSVEAEANDVERARLKPAQAKRSIERRKGNDPRPS